MKCYIILFFIILSINQSFSFETYKLANGMTVKGEMDSETNDTLSIKTDYGIVTINKANILYPIFILKLKSNEIYIGIKSSDNSEETQLETIIGNLTFDNNNIIHLSMIGEYTRNELKSLNIEMLNQYDDLTTIYENKSTNKFSKGIDEAIDHYFHPTGFILNSKQLYASGLSAGIGFNDRLQISTEWYRWLPLGWTPDLNVRFKYQIFHNEELTKSNALSVGLHLHSNYQNRFIGSYQYDERGEYPLAQLFTAYTSAKALKNGQGQSSYTIGGWVHNDKQCSNESCNDDSELKKTVGFRLYYDYDIDINSRLKGIASIFYDYSSYKNYTYDDIDNNGLYIDLGFMYNVYANLNIGFHFLSPWIAFYWKF